MQIIEAQTYERYRWQENGNQKCMYICVPVTLVIMNYKEIEKSQFIFWN